MSSDETPKIEPTLVLSDAPSIAADAPQARGGDAEPEPKSRSSRPEGRKHGSRMPHRRSAKARA